MKKIFTLFLFAFTSAAFAQSFSAYETNNAQTVLTTTLTNGYTLPVLSSPSTPTSNVITGFKVKLINNSASTLTLSVKRRIVENTPALLLNGAGNVPDTYFCFGYQCFPSNVSSPGPADYCILGASGSTVAPFDNSKDNGTPFVIDLEDGLTVGYYIVSYTLLNINNPNDSLMFYVKYNAYLSVQENANVIESVGDLYPNPSSNTVNFALQLKKESAVKVEVFNSLGSLVYNTTEKRSIGKNKLSFDCSTFNSGLYFVTITSGESKITKRLAITK